MTIQTYWQLDVAADPARSEPSRQGHGHGVFRGPHPGALNRYDYYVQVGQAAAQTAFDGLFLPHRPESDDSAIVAAAIAREVPRLTLIPEFPASRPCSSPARARKRWRCRRGRRTCICSQPSR